MVQKLGLPSGFASSETMGKLHASLPLEGHATVFSLSVRLGNLDDTREVFGTQSMFNTHFCYCYSHHLCSKLFHCARHHDRDCSRGGESRTSVLDIAVILLGEKQGWLLGN